MRVTPESCGEVFKKQVTGSVALTFWGGPAGEPAIDAANTLTVGALSFGSGDKNRAGLIAIGAAEPATMPALCRFKRFFRKCHSGITSSHLFTTIPELQSVVIFVKVSLESGHEFSC